MPPDFRTWFEGWTDAEIDTAGTFLSLLRTLTVPERMAEMGMERWCPNEETSTPQFCECELYVEATDA